jgi:DNA-binding NtrC family response regulator
MTGNSILIIDDDRDVLDALNVLLEDEFRQVITENNTNRIEQLARAQYDAILLDMNFSAGINTGNEGLFWLTKILQSNPAAVVIMMTAYGNINLAVEAIKRGAKDFVLKPWDNDKLIASIRACMTVSKNSMTTQFGQVYKVQNDPIIGKSPVMQELLSQVEKVAVTDASVLLLGENGTGKEIVARQIHQRSPRASRPFVPVDMTSLTTTLFESELFGHKKGAFTDARAERKGKFEAADGGTLFLDEIANLPLPQQAKLLTVLQQREVIPVGSNLSVAIDVRVISATNALLTDLVSKGSFRQDLLYRINTITLHIPPLRDRGEDILLLADHYLEHYKRKYNKESLYLEDLSKKVLMVHPWPGNVRELQHTMEKAVILSSGPAIGTRDLNLSLSAGSQAINPVARTLDALEKEALQNALQLHGGNIVQAAKALGITRQTFYNKMKKYGI